MRAKKGLQLKGKKIAVVGMGVSGISALKLLAQEGAEAWAVNQGHPEKWARAGEVLSVIPAERCLSQESPELDRKLASMNMIVLAPGIPREHPMLAKAHLYNVPVWGEIELGAQFVHYPVIAVTGSNGKTTTTSLLGEMIRLPGKRAFVGGNIGTPLCEFARGQEPYDVILLELSSFQLESVFEFRADIALILNLVPTHGERYSKVEDYGKAKWRLAERVAREGHLFYDGKNELLHQWAQGAPSSSTAVDSSRLNDIRAILGRKFDMSRFKLPGDHNLLNLFFAVNALEAFNKRFAMFAPEELQKGMQAAIDTFGGVPHRVQLVEGNKAYACYNDSKSTNWEATCTAVKAMPPGAPTWLILGGKLRGQGESILPHLLLIKQKIERLLVFGESANQIEEEVFDQMPLRKFRTLEDVIRFTDEQGHKGNLLFSPGFPSFDLYKNYEERGAHFIKLVGGKAPPPVEGH